jgi:hypothetical protein
METLQEFYNFFNDVPADKWVKGSLTDGDTHCALGLLNCKTIGWEGMNHDGQLLTKLLAQSRAIPVDYGSRTGIVWRINDGYYFKEIDNPKDRILYAIKLAMDSESITEFLDELMLAFLDELFEDSATPAVQVISGEEFKQLLDNSAPRDLSEYVGIKTSDDGFINSLLNAQHEFALNPDQKSA